MMQNAVNESFWDAKGVEIEACANANFKRKSESEIFSRIREKSHNPNIFSDWMLWVARVPISWGVERDLDGVGGSL